MACWDGVIGKDEINRYAKAGFGGEGGIGQRPALLVIDVQYRTVGTKPMPYCEAIEEYPMSCGDVGWDAVGNIAQLVALFRQSVFQSFIRTSPRRIR